MSEITHLLCEYCQSNMNNCDNIVKPLLSTEKEIENVAEIVPEQLAIVDGENNEIVDVINDVSENDSTCVYESNSGTYLAYTIEKICDSENVANYAGENVGEDSDESASESSGEQIDHIAEASFKEKCQRGFERLVSKNKEKKNVPAQLSTSSPDLSPASLRIDYITRRRSSATIRFGATEKRPSMEELTDKSKIIRAGSFSRHFYDAFLVSIDGSHRGLSKLSTLDLVQTGYHGLTVYSSPDQFYIIYSKTKLNAMRKIMVSDYTTFTFNDVIEQCAEWFPFYVKIIGAKSGESDFKRTFLLLMDAVGETIGLRHEQTLNRNNSISNSS